MANEKINRRVLNHSPEEVVNIPTATGIRFIANNRDYARLRGDYLHYVDAILKEIPEVKERSL